MRFGFLTMIALMADKRNCPKLQLTLTNGANRSTACGPAGGILEPLPSVALAPALRRSPYWVAMQLGRETNSGPVDEDLTD